MALATLIVDDDRSFSSLAASALSREGHAVVAAHSLHEARGAADKQSFDLVILDRRLPDGDGLSWLPELKTAQPSARVIMVTAHGDIANAVAAIRDGASDYVVKPVELAELLIKAGRANEEISLRDRLDRVESEMSGRRSFVPPESAKMKQVVSTLERAASSTKSPLLLLGETGTGKEVLAWHAHLHSTGLHKPFVHVNCAALPDSIAEGELFGHERGAYTDARAARRGLIETASSGSLFLDEVGELSPQVQAKLLTFLDSGDFRRLGSSTSRTSSARIIAATNRDLQAEVKAGRFREDLWFRLSVFCIQIPPLRERREDVVPLARGLLERVSTVVGRKAVVLSQSAIDRLKGYDFPGNVRELQNVLERALVLEQGPELMLETLASAPRAAATTTASANDFVISGPVLELEEVEQRYVRHALEAFGGRRMDAAKALGLSYPTFLKRLGE